MTAAAMGAERTAFRLGYRPSLDGLRGVAILAVVVHHTRQPFIDGGYLGVDLFFVLSGFLITTILVEEWTLNGAIRFRQFYLRRALRLLPALIVLLAAYVVLSVTVSLVGIEQKIPTPVGLTVLAVFFYQANWVWGFDLFDLGPLEHTWSLSVEEQYYLLWPMVLVALLRRVHRRQRLIALVGLGVIASASWRVQVWRGASSWERPYSGLDTRADALLIGSALALIATMDLLPDSETAKRVLRIASTVATLVLVWFIVVAPIDADFMYLGGFTLVAIAAAVVIAQVLVGLPKGINRVLTSAGLVWVGRLSYSLYLWHIPVAAGVYLGVDRGAVPAAAAIPVKIGLSLIAATLSFYFVERPCLRLKSRFRTPSAPPGVGTHAVVSGTPAWPPGETVGQRTMNL